MASIEILRFPATLSVIVLCTVIYFYQWSRRVEDFTAIGFRYANVVTYGEYWRIITSTFSHISLSHLVFNMYSLYLCQLGEESFGGLGYIKISLLLVVVSTVLLLLLFYVMIEILNAEGMTNVYIIGYSGVVFAWFAFLSALDPSAKVLVFGIFLVPQIAAPWLVLALTHLIMPQASLTGHLCGIASGYLLAIRGHNNSLVHEYVDLYGFSVALFWTLIGFLSSLKVSHPDLIPWLEVLTFEGDVVVRERSHGDLEMGDFFYDREAVDGVHGGANEENADEGEAGAGEEEDSVVGFPGRSVSRPQITIIDGLLAR